MATVHIRERRSYDDAGLEELLHWLEAAYGDPIGSWRTEHWLDLGPGPHLTIEDRGELLAHACIAWIPVVAGTTTVRAAYLEDVATRSDMRGRGYATSLVAAARPLIESAELGLLSTGSPGFYERLGWVRWDGPTSVTEPDGGVTPTPEEDDGIMGLLVSRTPAGVAPGMPIRRPRRDPVESW